MERMEKGGTGSAGSSRVDKPSSAGGPRAGWAPALLVRLSGGDIAGAVPGVSLQPVSARRLCGGGRATGRAGRMCLVLRAFLHCVFLSKWLLFLDPGSC